MKFILQKEGWVLTVVSEAVYIMSTEDRQCEVVFKYYDCWVKYRSIEPIDPCVDMEEVLVSLAKCEAINIGDKWIYIDSSKDITNFIDGNEPWAH